MGAQDFTQQQNRSMQRLAISDGTIEALKWLALVLMLIDHVNAVLFDYAYPSLYSIGRVAMPLFAFVLAYNLARTSGNQQERRVMLMRRLAAFTAISAIPYALATGLGFWPMNVMATFLVAVLMVHLIEARTAGTIAAAVLLFLAGGFLVDYLWFGLAVCLAAYWYCRQPRALSYGALVMALLTLTIIHDNAWALLALPVIWMAGRVRMNVPRSKHLFYVFYPAHLLALWILKKALFG